MERIRTIMEYIQKHYTDKITLKDLADQIHLCRSECCRMFKRCMNETMFEYLLYYRIEKRLELLRCDPPQNTVLIEPLEDAVQFPAPLLHSSQFPFQPTHLFSDLRRLSAADVRCKLLGVFPGHCCHPPQILQDHVIQYALPDIVGGAEGAVLLVSPAGEVVVGPAHGMGAVEHHGAPAVGAHHQPGILVLFIHVGAPPLVLAHPLDNVIAMGTLAGNIGISLVRVLCGYAAAVLLGVPLGVAMGYYAGLHRLLNLFLGMFRPIPPLAWVPLVLAWFGVSSLATAMGLPRSELYYYLNNLKISMLFIIFIGALFPILTSAVHGVQTVNRTLVDSARVLGASERDIFTKILLPAAAPSIVNGLRIGLGVAWMCLVSAEMLPGSLSGVGYLITHAYTVGRTDVVIAGMISISVVGALLDMAFQWIERRKYAWKQFSR